MGPAFSRKYNTPTTIHIPLIKRGVVDFALGADWVPAAGDVRVSIDGAAPNNIGTLPTATTMGNTSMWNFPLSGAETSGKKIMVTIADAATKVIEDQMFLVETYGHASAEHLVDFTDAIAFGLSALPNAIVRGTVTTGASPTSIPTSALSPAATVIDQFVGRVVVFTNTTTTAALRSQAARITGNTAGGVLTVSALTTSPVSGDTFVIV